MGTWWVLDGYLMSTWSRGSMIENIGLGIFNWALEGLRDYLKVGPEDSWGSHQGNGNGWIPTGERQHRILIAECCELGRFKTCKNAALYGQYLNFYVILGLGPLSQKPKIHTTPETLRIWCTTYTKSSKYSSVASKSNLHQSDKEGERASLSDGEEGGLRYV